MKRFSLFLLILLLVPLISAVEFDVNDEFSQGETLMAKVSGNFLQPLQKENVVFYRGHVRVPMEHDIKRLEDEYFIYASLLGKEENNYSIALENIQYMSGAEVSEEDIVREFSINNQTADFWITPGFANTNPFTIDVQNLQDNEITIEMKTKEDVEDAGEEYQEPIDIKSGQTKSIEFLIETPEPVFRWIEISTENLAYNIPASLPAVEVEVEELFRIEPDSFIVSSATGQETTRTVYIYNTGEEALRDITISLSDSLKDYASISETEISRINPDSNAPIEITFSSEQEIEVEGHIKAEQDLEIVYCEISAKFLQDYIDTTIPPDPETSEEKTCAELGYPICSSDQVCSSGDLVYAKDSPCCVGVCNERETSGRGALIGILIIVVVAGFVIWFFKKKYKGAKKPLDLLKIARGKKKPNPRPQPQT